MTKAKKAKLERIAIKVCNRHLGTIPRDRQTLDALEVMRVYLSSDGARTEVTERHERIYEHLLHAFHQEINEHVPIVYLAPVEVDKYGVDDVAMDYVTLTFWDQVEPMFMIAWAEVERRENYGQDVEGKLNELSLDLVVKLTVDCRWSFDLTRRGRLARMYRLSKGGLKS
jgi:hypothetical protein